VNEAIQQLEGLVALQSVKNFAGCMSQPAQSIVGYVPFWGTLRQGEPHVLHLVCMMWGESDRTSTQLMPDLIQRNRKGQARDRFLLSWNFEGGLYRYTPIAPTLLPVDNGSRPVVSRQIGLVVQRWLDIEFQDPLFVGVDLGFLHNSLMGHESYLTPPDFIVSGS
jgi:hypothetical protein